MKYEITLAGRLARPEDAEGWLDDVMAQLEALEGADPAIGGSMTDGELEVSITVDAEGIEAAIARATTHIRAAIDASGAGVDAVVWERLVATTAVAAPAR